MKRGMSWVGLVLVVLAAGAGGQAREADGADRPEFRVESGGNELSALREAPVAYTAIDRLMEEIGQADVPDRAAIRVRRGSPRQTVDYVLCVTSAGTLVVAERVHTFDEGEQRFRFTRGEIARSYPPLEKRDEWLWLVGVALSREATVTFEARAAARWPVATVTLRAVGGP